MVELFLIHSLEILLKCPQIKISHSRRIGCKVDEVQQRLLRIRTPQLIPLSYAKVCEITSNSQEHYLLPFHDVGEKFRRLGKEYKMNVHHAPSEDVLKWIKEEFESTGLKVKMHG